MRVPVTPGALPTTRSCEAFSNGVNGDSARAREQAGLSAMERHRVGLAAAVDFDVQTLGQGVDDGGADAVQTAGRRVGAAAELAAGVQLREHDLDAVSPVRGSTSTGMPRARSRTSTLPSACRTMSIREP
jgi:hypothetical protein